MWIESPAFMTTMRSPRRAETSRVTSRFVISEQYIVPASKPPDKPHVWSLCACVRSQWRTPGNVLVKLKPSTTNPSKGARKRLTSACWVAMFVVSSCGASRSGLHHLCGSQECFCAAPACDSASAFSAVATDPFSYPRHRLAARIAPVLASFCAGAALASVGKALASQAAGTKRGNTPPRDA